MGKPELARILAEMTRTMEQARAERTAQARNSRMSCHQTDADGWCELKKVLNYAEPALERKDC